MQMHAPRWTDFDSGYESYDHAYLIHLVTGREFWIWWERERDFMGRIVDRLTRLVEVDRNPRDARIETTNVDIDSDLLHDLTDAHYPDPEKLIDGAKECVLRLLSHEQTAISAYYAVGADPQDTCHCYRNSSTDCEMYGCLMVDGEREHVERIRAGEHNEDAERARERDELIEAGHLDGFTEADFYMGVEPLVGRDAA